MSTVDVLSARRLLAVPPGEFLPALFALTPSAAKRTLEFFTANIRNANTRKAYARAVGDFSAWCEK